MDSINVVIKKFSDKVDETLLFQSIGKIMGVTSDVFRFIPIVFEVKNATRDFMLHLPSFLPNCIVSPQNIGKDIEFIALPQIGTTGDAYEIWKSFMNTAVLTNYRLSSMFSGFNTDILMPGIIKSDFFLLTNVQDVRNFILKYEKKWNSQPDAYTQEWENLTFAKRLLDTLRENAPALVNDIVFQLDPDITSDVLPSRNWIRVTREVRDGDKTAFNLYIFTTFAFHMLAEKPIQGIGTVIARHEAEAGDIEVSDNGGTMFLSIASDSRIEIFPGNHNRHGLRIYGEWEFHSLQRAMQAYMKNPGINGNYKQRKYNVACIFQNIQDLEEFCFIFANS